ncbi:MAG: bifunctional demethylmenaquinone methyltransferase/2-methoxy-6-polyprenyl-1,4-benzoquinol methylase UbiE [bacterium]
MKDFIKELNKEENREEKYHYVQNTFESISPVYDKMNDIMSFGMHRVWRKYAVKKIALSPGETVLDACCGTGDFAQESARAVGVGGRVFATDFCSGMVQEGAGKADRDYLFSRVIRFGVADTTKIPFKNGIFDAVTVSCGIRNLNDIDLGFREIFRVLKPGGRFACLDLGRPNIPVFSTIYNTYFEKVVPLVGKLIHGDAEPYDYLPQSLKEFPDREELSQRIKEAGFVKVNYTDLAGGAMVLHVAIKGV